MSLADVIAKPLSIIFGKSWQSGLVLGDWKKRNIIPMFKKGRKEDPGNFRQVNLSFLPGKDVEQVLVGAMFKAHAGQRGDLRDH